MRKENQALYRIVFVGLMAAMILVLSITLRIPIVTPVGPTQIKTSNILCLLAGMLFGGIPGGLASGIGSMLFDLLTPDYVRYAPFTLVFFFVMGAVCGFISHLGGAKGQNLKLNLLGAVLGAAAYWTLNAGRNVLELMLGENHMSFALALAANSTKLATSALNVVIAVVGSMALVLPLQRALRKAGVLRKMGL